MTLGVLGLTIGLCGSGVSLVWGATHYVSSDGNNARTCNETLQEGTPHYSLSQGLTCLTEPGDTLVLRGGTYEEAVTLDRHSSHIPSGTSWENSITIRAYDNEEVIIRSGSNDSVFSILHSDAHHLILDSLIVDATGSTHGVYLGGAVHHVRLNHVEIRHAVSHGIEVSSGGEGSVPHSSHEFLNLHVHDNGTSSAGGYGIVLGTSGNHVTGSMISSNSNGGLLVKGASPSAEPSYTVILGNKFSANGQDTRAWGIQIESGTNHLLLNNVVSSHGQGIFIDGSQSQVLHNTVVGPGATGLMLGSASTDTLVHNNIVYGFGTNVDSTASSNAILSHNVTSLPLFVGADTQDFRLQSTSPAIDAGIDVGPLLAHLLSEDLVDAEGVARPQGAGWDVGAHEWQGLSAEAPIATFSTTSVTGPSPFVANFLDQSSGDIGSWLWDFGDGSASVDRHPTHVYEASGAYTVGLTVSGPGGIHSVSHPQLIQVTPSPPQAEFSANVVRGEVPLTVSFTNSTTGDADSWDWNFGDDTSSSDRDPHHTFATPGTYTVQLSADGPLGNDIETKTAFVSVHPPLGVELFQDYFSGSLSSDWLVVDEGFWQGPSRWAVVTGSLVQTSNIWSPPADPAVLPQLGTYVWYAPGFAWTNYRIQSTLRSDDDDALGLMFRYQDAGNYYRFSWDLERGHRRLLKKVNGTFALLAEDSIPYARGQAYPIEILAYGNTLEVRVNDGLIFNGAILDDGLSSGSVGFYSWFNNGSVFDEIVVTELDMVSVHP
jgi:parallel beta-helix repeat protein